MVYELIFKKRFSSKLEKVFIYLEKEFGISIAKKFAILLDEKFKTLSENPEIGMPSSLMKVRSFIAGKNRVYYRIEKTKIIILNMYDMRINPSKNKLK